MPRSASVMRTSPGARPVCGGAVPPAGRLPREDARGRRPPEPRRAPERGAVAGIGPGSPQSAQPSTGGPGAGRRRHGRSKQSGTLRSARHASESAARRHSVWGTDGGSAGSAATHVCRFESARGSVVVRLDMMVPWRRQPGAAVARQAERRVDGRRATPPHARGRRPAPPRGRSPRTRPGSSWRMSLMKASACATGSWRGMMEPQAEDGEPGKGGVQTGWAPPYHALSTCARPWTWPGRSLLRSLVLGCRGEVDVGLELV